MKLYKPETVSCTDEEFNNIGMSICKMIWKEGPVYYSGIKSQHFDKHMVNVIMAISELINNEFISECLTVSNKSPCYIYKMTLEQAWKFNLL